MFKLLFVVALAVVCSQAAPSPGVVAYASAPVVAAPLATSSQVIARNYNGVYAAAPIVAAHPAAYAAAPVVAARYAAYNPYYNPYAATYVL